MSNGFDPVGSAGGRDPGDDEVARLVRRAAPRAIPRATAERVHDAVHAAWRSRPRRRSRPSPALSWRAWSLAAAAVLVLAVVSVRLLDRPSSVDPVGGLAQVKLVLGGSNVRPGTTVEASSWVTTEDDGLVALELDGRSIRLAPDSRARILEPDELELGRGAVYVDSGASAGAGIAVLTSSGRVTELGTRFEVRLEPTALRVRVRDGRVAVDDGTRRNEAGEGIELTLHDSGEVSDRDIDVFGPEWEWTMRAAPAPAIEGRPLGELLGWVESESGYPVVFRDAASERRARETVLHGDVDGLAPLEALAATLATSGLTHRLESGRLVLEAEQGDAMQ